MLLPNDADLVFDSKGLFDRLGPDIVAGVVGVSKAGGGTKLDDGRIARMFGGKSSADVGDSLGVEGEGIGRAAVGDKRLVGGEVFAFDLAAVDFAVEFTPTFPVRGVFKEERAGQFIEEEVMAELGVGAQAFKEDGFSGGRCSGNDNA